MTSDKLALAHLERDIRDLLVKTETLFKTAVVQRVVDKLDEAAKWLSGEYSEPKAPEPETTVVADPEPETVAESTSPVEVVEAPPAPEPTATESAPPPPPPAE